ncbi:MAG: hypothetical protein IJ852_01735 [Alphaproteobacteria bacterium]|nr:hypothetical protein [Alphaproteobacteria bacterium]
MSLRLAQRTNKSISCTLPAPIKGLNVRDNLSDMGREYAIKMDNYLPSDTKVSLRPGFVSYVQTEAKVCTLKEYHVGSSAEFLAVSGGKIWNISSRTNPYSYDNVSLSEDYCQTAQYKNYLYFVNGLDVPKVYYIDDNGVEHLEDWGFSATSLQAANIVNVGVSKQRLWFVEKNTLKVWYTQTAGNVSGTLQCFDLSQVSRFGGRLIAVANWTQDGGQGIDDLTVFITSEGEALVYSGSDINRADMWTLKGSYKISRPIGYNCLVAYQGDVIVISEDGYIPLSKALPLGQVNASAYAFSDTIRGLVLARTAKYATKKGWQGIIYGRGGYAIFNVPIANQFEQHVVNVNTGAWCRFTDLRSQCWGEFNGRMFFGSDDGIYLFDEGYSDNGVKICGSVEQAFHNLGSDNLKKIQLLNPRTKSSSAYALVIYTNMDMEKRNIDYEESIGHSGTTKWNEAKWSNTLSPIGTKWGVINETDIQSQWIANSSTGYKASIVFKTKTKGNLIEWYETGVRYEVGSGVL